MEKVIRTEEIAVTFGSYLLEKGDRSDFWIVFVGERRSRELIRVWRES